MSKTILEKSLFRKFLLTTTSGILLLIVSGCSSTKGYEGDPDPGVEVANVRCFGCRFNSVNGKVLGVLVSSVDILPGKNKFYLTIDASNFNSRGPTPVDPTFALEMNAEPGVNYIVTGRRGVRQLCAFPVIPESGEPDVHHAAGCIARE